MFLFTVFAAAIALVFALHAAERPSHPVRFGEPLFDSVTDAPRQPTGAAGGRER